MNSLEAEEWLDIINGKTILSWELWSAPISRSNCLNEVGKKTLMEMVLILPEMLGDNWIGKRQATL